MAKTKVIAVANQKGGVFLTMANETNFRKDVVASVRANFGKSLPVMQTVIPATVRQYAGAGGERTAQRVKHPFEHGSKRPVPPGRYTG